MSTDVNFCSEILEGTKVWCPGESIQCKSIRLFLISSSTEFTLERRLYYESIEPELAKFASKYSLSLETFDPCVASSETSVHDSSENNKISPSCTPCSFELTDPVKLNALLKEITNASSSALATFFIFFINNNYGPVAVPLTLGTKTFDHLHSVISSSTHSEESRMLNSEILNSFYTLDSNNIPECYTFNSDATKFTFNQLENIFQFISSDENTRARVDELEMQQQQQQQEEKDNLLKSHVHIILKQVLKLQNRPSIHILSFVKVAQVAEASAVESVIQSTDTSQVQVNCVSPLLEDVICEVNKSNIFFLSDPLTEESSSECLNKKIEKYEHQLYTEMMDRLKSSIELTYNLLIEYPMTVVAEAESHLYNLSRKLPSLSNECNFHANVTGQISKLLIQASSNMSNRHSPIIIQGSPGSGKSTFLAYIYEICVQCLSSCTSPTVVTAATTTASNSSGDFLPATEQVIRITRLLGKSPESSYSSELIKSISDQIIHSCALDQLQDIESMSLSTRFQELLKLIELDTSMQLVIILDDLHKIKTLQMSSILNWLPWSLPCNVHLICSISSTETSMLNVLKSRISSEYFIHLNSILTPSDGINYIEMSLVNQSRRLTSSQRNFILKQLEIIDEKSKRNLTAAAASSSSSSPERVSPNDFTLNYLYLHLLSQQVVNKWPSSLQVDCEQFKYPSFPLTIGDVVNAVLWSLEEQLGFNLVCKVCTYISFTRFGFRESEILELISSEDSNVTVSTWFHMKNILTQGLLDEYMVMGRCSFHWCHNLIIQSVQSRYRSHSGPPECVHRELGQAFFLGFTETVGVLENNRLGVTEKCDVYREMDELWYHLLESNDINRLKRDAVLSIDFLMSCVLAASIYYLKVILELVTGHILDFEIELLINMLKHSTSTLLLDASQLATEIILWLKPFTTTPNTLPSPITSPTTLNKTLESLTQADMQCKTIFLDKLVTEARSWSLKRPNAFLVPTNTWLKLPLPQQMRIITCPWTAVGRAVISKDNQNVIACTGEHWQIFHLASRTLKYTFEGSGGKQTCIAISKSGRYLVTGSDDSLVKLWEFTADTFVEKYKLRHHTAGILCVEMSPSEQLILSGSENGVVAVVDLKSGMLKCKIIHHKGMVTSICVNSGNDVFTIGSTDCSVSVWSVNNCSFLNQMFLPKPIFLMDISKDSTFLMVICEDNAIHIRALTTGTDIHTLDHPSSHLVSYAKFAQDSCRAIVGTGDGKVLIYDVHSGKLIQTLVGHSDMITVIIPTVNDRFLLTCGGSKLIIWNFSTRKDLLPSDSSSVSKKCPSVPVTTVVTSSSNNSNNNQRSTVSSSSVSSRMMSSSTRTSYTKYSRPPSKRVKKVENHSEAVTCVAVSRDGTLAVTGSLDSLVKIWTLSNGETHTTLAGHRGAITCITFSANGLFVVSGSEDTNLTVWGLTVGLIVSTFSEHRVKPIAVQVSHDSKKILSIDESGIHRLWIADTGQQIFVLTKPTHNVTLHGNNIFAQPSKLSNTLRYWSTFDPDNEKSVNHTESITCYYLTYDGLTLVTGSNDKSLKVWEVSSSKLTQILVGHEGAVTCVHIAALKPSLIISGSLDCNSIVWDMTTGTEMFTLTGHTSKVSHVRLSLDGSMALTAGDDNLLIIWSEKGTKIAILNVHQSFVNFATPLNTDQVVIQLNNNQMIGMIKLHNNPAKGKTIDLPPGTPIDGFTDQPFPIWRGIIPGSKKPLGRTLKRDQSFDSFYFESLNRGVSVDDFRKLTASSSISRDLHLSTAGIMWDINTSSSTAGVSSLAGMVGSACIDRSIASSTLGATTSILNSSSVTRSPITIGPLARMKLGPKQKILKKQQSMFAFFPEQSSSQIKLSTITFPIKECAEKTSPIGGALIRSQSDEKDNSPSRTPLNSSNRIATAAAAATTSATVASATATSSIALTGACGASSSSNHHSQCSTSAFVDSHVCSIS